MSGKKVTKRKRSSNESAQLAAAKITMQTKLEELESQNSRLKAENTAKATELETANSVLKAVNAENTALQARVAAQAIDIVSYKGTHIVHIFISL